MVTTALSDNDPVNSIILCARAAPVDPSETDKLTVPPLVTACVVYPP